MTRRTLFALCAMAILISLPALAAPNFSGTWKLNVSKSDFGQMPAPNSQTQTIKHEDPKMAITVKSSSDQGDFEYTLNYTTDGKESKNEFRGSPRTSVVKWSGDTLVVETKMKFGDNDISITEKWTLSADGKTLTVNRHFVSSMGEGDAKSVLEKQ